MVLLYHSFKEFSINIFTAVKICDKIMEHINHSTVVIKLNKAKTFLKEEIVLIISAVLATVSAFFVKPTAAYFEYIDFRTLGLLLCLMLVMAGLNRMGIFSLLAQKMLGKTKNLRSLGLVLSLLCFFSAMVITNDVALITFVPFTVTALELSGKKKALIPIVVIETVAANLGSMLTPIGNPQNLYLFSAFNMGFGEFFSAVAPYAALSLVLTVIAAFMFRKEDIKIELTHEKPQPEKAKLIIYIVLFMLSLLTVFRVIPYPVTLGITLIAVIIADRKTLAKADYSLLLTFIFLFIFIGNLGKIEAVSTLLQSLVKGREVLVGIAASQVFSNVPAAILLSSFTDNAAALLTGVNLGGLGTLIASMASLISFKLIAKEKISTGRYMLVFTAVNVAFLAANLALWWIYKG